MRLRERAASAARLPPRSRKKRLNGLMRRCCVLPPSTRRCRIHRHSRIIISRKRKMCWKRRESWRDIEKQESEVRTQEAGVGSQDSGVRSWERGWERRHLACSERRFGAKALDLKSKIRDLKTDI